MYPLLLNAYRLIEEVRSQFSNVDLRNEEVYMATAFNEFTRLFQYIHL